MELNRTSSEVALAESHKKSYLPSFNCCFGWSTFQSLVLLGLILLNVVLIVILLPLVSTSIARLDKIVDKVDGIDRKSNAIHRKVNAINNKVEKLDKTQVRIEGKTKWISGLFWMGRFGGVLRSILGDVLVNVFDGVLADVFVEFSGLYLCTFRNNRGAFNVLFPWSPFILLNNSS